MLCSLGRKEGRKKGRRELVFKSLSTAYGRSYHDEVEIQNWEEIPYYTL